MTYSAFIGRMKEKVQEELGREYKVEITSLPKNNRKDVKTLMITWPPRQGKDAGVAVSLEKSYQEYRSGKTIDECAADLLVICKKRDNQETLEIAEEVKQWELVKDRIHPMVLSRAGNEEYLENLQTRSLNDLAVLYYITVDVGGNRGNIKVTKALCRHWNIPEEEIYSQAMINLENDGYRMTSIREMIGELIGQNVEKDKELMYVLTNEEMYYGAAAILSDNILKECSAQLKVSFYLLPSSVNELIIIPDDNKVQAGELKKMVMEINRECVAEDDRLSDSIYYYCMDKGTVHVAA